MREYDPALIQATLDLLARERMIVVVVAKAYAGKAAATEKWCVHCVLCAWSSEGKLSEVLNLTKARRVSSPPPPPRSRRYGTAYNDRPIPAALLEELAAAPNPALPELHLPKPNEFIPSDFDLVTPDLGDQKGKGPRPLTIKTIVCMKKSALVCEVKLHLSNLIL